MKSRRHGSDETFGHYGEPQTARGDLLKYLYGIGSWGVAAIALWVLSLWL